MRYLKSKRIADDQAGFTILEVVMALMIISIGLVGVTSLVKQNIQVSHINKNAVISAQLAQEGIELVRKIRDENWIKNTAPWYLNIGNGTYVIDYTDKQGAALTPPVITGIDDANARLYHSNGFYSHNTTGSITPYYRIITISEDPNASKEWIRVECLVRFKRHPIVYDYTASTVLYNWEE